jgi:hypothetical protein
MRNRRLWFPAVPALLLLSACASADEWAIWKEHPSHFASSNHLMFSMRNRESKAVQVTRADVAMARDQAWWGKPVTVDQAQIIER